MVPHPSTRRWRSGPISPPCRPNWKALTSASAQSCELQTSTAQTAASPGNVSPGKKPGEVLHAKSCCRTSRIFVCLWWQSSTPVPLTGAVCAKHLGPVVLIFNLFSLLLPWHGANVHSRSQFGHQNRVPDVGFWLRPPAGSSPSPRAPQPGRRSPQPRRAAGGRGRLDASLPPAPPRSPAGAGPPPPPPNFGARRGAAPLRSARPGPPPPPPPPQHPGREVKQPGAGSCTLHSGRRAASIPAPAGSATAHFFALICTFSTSRAPVTLPGLSPLSGLITPRSPPHPTANSRSPSLLPPSPSQGLLRSSPMESREREREREAEGREGAAPSLPAPPGAHASPFPPPQPFPRRFPPLFGTTRAPGAAPGAALRGAPTGAPPPRGPRYLVKVPRSHAGLRDWAPLRAVSLSLSTSPARSLC